jgi:hypothetical protein
MHAQTKATKLPMLLSFLPTVLHWFGEVEVGLEEEVGVGLEVVGCSMCARSYLTENCQTNAKDRPHYDVSFYQHVKMLPS